MSIIVIISLLLLVSIVIIVLLLCRLLEASRSIDMTIKQTREPGEDTVQGIINRWKNENC